jgi:hypothetical protein
LRPQNQTRHSAIFPQVKNEIFPKKKNRFWAKKRNDHGGNPQQLFCPQLEKADVAVTE